MKKYILFIALFIIGVIIGYFSVSLFIDKSSRQIELTQKTNAGVPYEWEYEIENENIVKFVKKYTIEVNKNEQLEGGALSVNYVFKGNKKGITTVTFRYRNITTNKVEKESVYKLKVDKYKRISLIVADNV